MDNLKRRHPYQAFQLSPIPGPFEPIPLQSPDHDDLDDNIQKEKTLKSGPSPNRTWLLYCQEKQRLLTTVALTLLSLWTRFRLIGLSNFVVWDEAHFGKFASYYLKREFYFDVHPPLGKMLLALSGYLTGYDGSFGFDSAAMYPDTVNYTSMRIFTATWGALLVPLAYLTAQQFHMSQKACLLTASMVLFDTAYLCISRFILLDSLLLFFTSTSLYTLATFRNQSDKPFSRSWWTWLSLTGLSLGCVLSVKWVGLFAVALVGFYTVEELWDLLGDVQMPKKTYLCHWIARAVCLIGLPAMIYIASFAVHFAILTKSGPGDAVMSSLFQSTLEGNSLANNPLELAYGSVVTIKNIGYGGGLLHSHVQTYPEGSRQQQVTSYHHKDRNNEWQVRFARNSPQENLKVQEASEETVVRFVKNGDVIRLYHPATQRNLHSHRIPAPLTSSQWEVSGYGNDTVGDLKDNWRIEIVKDPSTNENQRVQALKTTFRLRHVLLDCLLTTNGVSLPAWGFRQLEVGCDRSNHTDDSRTWWNIEEHKHDALPPAEKNTFKSPFFKDFLHLNIAMWRSNNALVLDPEKIDNLASKPTDWPFLSVGLRMCSWDDEKPKYYMLGNPVVWWSAGLALSTFVATVFICLIRMRRNIKDFSKAQWARFYSVGKIILSGWLLHYIPFFIMGRILYLHHYFPALYFGIFMVPYLLDYATSKSSARVRNAVYAAAFIAVTGTFFYFAPVAFGIQGSSKPYAGRHWRQNWSIA
ncbi:Dolichyl-phosphate-mannose-protein mannosyltransferase-domain-containing protein [Radiomyces spectabilis]|uniref:Dolichyl-phosphate-mannose-protein mannosyltransferase-domain-containing protein n=1 Tax=Radiomyces spectabilis TaxID=64574 RepID=UPI002220724B|nr:Dolichyl-phosphate-mannose-protein mannosyltransferase-domain-containing protein [Radiomyces spectabilis]KAI8391371.1 Dolichyl-phosphate-mannose-protein mannosyltransferase-domain-containing protein [Radiomyces spectabilis]